jgi:4'-phosphopantetheinyl transferase
MKQKRFVEVLMMSLQLTIWSPSPANLRIDRHEVHIWRAPLDQDPQALRAFYHILSRDERERAARYYFRKTSEHFVVGRGVLRSILGRYLCVEPEQLYFRYDSHGKPSLSSVADGLPLRFNVSHSNGLALYAFASGREVGIDVEYVRDDLSFLQVAAQFFSPQEAKVIRDLPDNIKAEYFFKCWTRKEAYIKARGEGLSFPLDQFSVSFAPGTRAALLYVRNNPQEVHRWSLKELMPGLGYVAAAALEGHDLRVTYWQWDSEKCEHCGL